MSQQANCFLLSVFNHLYYLSLKLRGLLLFGTEVSSRGSCVGETHPPHGDLFCGWWRLLVWKHGWQRWVMLRPFRVGLFLPKTTLLLSSIVIETTTSCKYRHTCRLFPPLCLLCLNWPEPCTKINIYLAGPHDDQESSWYTAIFNLNNRMWAFYKIPKPCKFYLRLRWSMTEYPWFPEVKQMAFPHIWASGNLFCTSLSVFISPLSILYVLVYLEYI